MFKPKGWWTTCMLWPRAWTHETFLGPKASSFDVHKDKQDLDWGYMEDCGEDLH